MTWLDKYGMTYALLRMAADPRPTWARALGLRGCLINNEEMSLPAPRLSFKRHLGSFAVHPRANEAYQARQVAHFERHLRQMLQDSRESAAGT